MKATLFSASALVGALLLTGCTADDGAPVAVTASAAATVTAPAAATVAPSATTAVPAVPAGDSDVPVLEGRVAALVLGIPGSGRIAFDPVLFLTGEEAGEAARARGDEDPPPNDYYIVNDDRASRDLPIAGGVAVAMVMDASGELCGDIAVGCPPISVEEWTAALEGTSGGLLRSMPYWLSVTDVTVTAVEQQFVP